MQDDKYFKEVIDGIKDRLEKNEVAIEDVKNDVDALKLSNVEVKTKLSSIELSQEQIKNMINETSRDNQKVILQLLDTLKEDRNTKSKIKMEENKVKFQDRKEIWAIISLLVGGLLAWLGLK